MLDIEEGMAFLDVGCGLGFTTALGAVLVGESGLVHGIDVIEPLVAAANENVVQALQLASIGTDHVSVYKMNVFNMDPQSMKFDRILVGALCPENVKSKLFSLLSPRGIMVLPMGSSYVGRLTRIPNSGTSGGRETFQCKCRTVPVKDSSLLLTSDSIPYLLCFFKHCFWSLECIF